MTVKDNTYGEMAKDDEIKMPIKCQRQISWGFLFITGICVLILLGLGTWQLKRMAWKNQIIAEIQTGMKTPPATALALDTWSQDARAHAYRPLSLTGRFTSTPLIHVGPKTHQERNGFHVYALFRPIGQKALWINCGWRPTRVSQWEAPQGTYTLLIRFMPPKTPGFFTPENHPDKNEWYWPDLLALSQTAAHAHPVIQAYGELMTSSPPLGFETITEASLQLPPNKHKGYAITWFLLALCVGMAGFYRARSHPA